MKPHHFIASLFGYKLIKKRKLDQSLERHLMDLFKRCGINCVLDVGANVGRYGTLLRNGGYRGRIVSFEPAAAPFAALVKASEGDSEWRTMHIGLGSRAETKVLNQMASSAFSSFHRPNEYGSERFSTVINILGTEEVAVSTLNGIWPDIVAGIPVPRVFLKMDTQGHDLEIFRGASDVLAYVCGLQVELSFKPIYDGTPDLIETLTAFRDQGFEITGFYPLTRDKESFAIIESDCVLQRPDAALPR